MSNIYYIVRRGTNACCSDSEKNWEWYFLDSFNFTREWLSFSECIISCTSSLSNGISSSNTFKVVFSRLNFVPPLTLLG